VLPILLVGRLQVVKQSTGLTVYFVGLPFLLQFLNLDQRARWSNRSAGE
jgi:hypothetical protein